MAGLAAARARGRSGGRKFALTKSQIRLAQVAMSTRDTKVSELCREIGVTRSTLYRYICPKVKSDHTHRNWSQSFILCKLYFLIPVNHA
jgi:DNA invertase Pin-like site-specific DNA recombinase